MFWHPQGFSITLLTEERSATERHNSIQSHPMKHSFKLILLCILWCCCTHLMASHPFQIRAFHLDFRTQVMTVEAIKSLATHLSEEGINTLVIEYEATFPFRENATLSNPYAFKESEVKDIVDHCAELGIDVIPLQNCFGHAEYILRHERYAHLREDNKDMSQVCPSEAGRAVEVFRSIFADIARLHPSPYIHIGADETRLLGHCKKCQGKEKSQLFADYLLAMCNIVKSLGKTPIIWADIILKYPDAIDQLPKDLIYVDWNYGWNPNHFGNLDNLIGQGAFMWGAPALRSHPDNFYQIDWMKHFRNLQTFIPFAREHHYQGIIETSWSTSGQYGYHYENGFEVQSIQPIRQVYPMIGCQILIDAYCQALRQENPLDIECFIKDYGKEKFDLDDTEATAFLKYFTEGTPLLIEPHKNRKEFAHFRLLYDLSRTQERYRKALNRLESPEFKADQRKVMATEIRDIYRESQRLNQRLRKALKGYLKEGCIEEIIRYKDERLEEILRSL